ncbi:MAG: extracellular solute-binding protein, partial [Ruminococcaceae bacterium]|nr:extracellular solute-binding protein [Oscillospiraceae bacterium]
HIESSVLSGTMDYDLVAGAENQLFAYAPEGLFANLYDVEHVDLAQPWWSRLFVENVTYDGKLFLITGDIAITAINNMNVIYFNKELLADYKLENPYDLVRSGKWTHDTMVKMIADSGVTTDLNGDSVMDENDQYGWLTSPLMTQGFISAYGMTVTEFGDDGDPVLTFFNADMNEKLDILSAFLHTGDDVFMIPNGATEVTTAKLNELFTNGHALFMTQTLAEVTTLRNLEYDFGILPYPKFDENQKQYTTHVLETNTVFGVPSLVKDEASSGLILEALAAEGYRTVIPAFYDVALTHKLTRDTESEEMLDIIREGRYFNFGHCNTAIFSSSGIVSEMFALYATNKLQASSFESRKPGYEANLEALIESYKSYGKKG